MKPPGAPKVSPVFDKGVGGARGGHSGHLLPGHQPSYGPDNSDLSDLRDAQNIPVISWLYHGFSMAMLVIARW
jgi:hypothetical protein